MPVLISNILPSLKTGFFFSSLRNMQLGDVGNQQKKNCEKNE